jgi:hypothetical protein
MTLERGTHFNHSTLQEIKTSGIFSQVLKNHILCKVFSFKVKDDIKHYLGLSLFKVRNFEKAFTNESNQLVVVLVDVLLNCIINAWKLHRDFSKDLLGESGEVAVLPSCNSGSGLAPIHQRNLSEVLTYSHLIVSLTNRFPFISNCHRAFSFSDDVEMLAHLVLVDYNVVRLNKQRVHPRNKYLDDHERHILEFLSRQSTGHPSYQVHEEGIEDVVFLHYVGENGLSHLLLDGWADGVQELLQFILFVLSALGFHQIRSHIFFDSEGHVHRRHGRVSYIHLLLKLCCLSRGGLNKHCHLTEQQGVDEY